MSFPPESGASPNANFLGLINHNVLGILALGSVRSISKYRKSVGINLDIFIQLKSRSRSVIVHNIRFASSSRWNTRWSLESCQNDAEVVFEPSWIRKTLIGHGNIFLPRNIRAPEPKAKKKTLQDSVSVSRPRSGALH